MRKIQLLLAAFVLLQGSLHASCGGCGRGESILSGVTGVAATTIGGISLDNLFTYNTVVGLALGIPGGTPFSFNGPVLVNGTGISELNTTTFLITEPGHYFATFVASTAALTLLGGVEYQLNGVPQGVNSSIVLAGTPLTLNQIINVTTVPATLQVVATGLGVTLATGTSATLAIVQLNSP